MFWDITCSSDTSVDFQRTARRYIPEDRTLHFNVNSNEKRSGSNTKGPFRMQASVVKNVKITAVNERRQPG
jgi:hypothetical protein